MARAMRGPRAEYTGDDDEEADDEEDNASTESVRHAMSNLTLNQRHGGGHAKLQNGGGTASTSKAAQNRDVSMESEDADICRVCRVEGTPEKQLHYPCVCTGSIKYIHQECLVEWLKYSKKEYCEVCMHKYKFTPIYAADMPKKLPLWDIYSGIVKTMATSIRAWFHYMLVAFAWLGFVPITSCRIFRCLFAGSLSAILHLPLDLLSLDNVWADCFEGCLAVSISLFAFIGIVWLREQIVHGGPAWLEQIRNQEEAEGAGAAENPIEGVEDFLANNNVFEPAEEFDNNVNVEEMVDNIHEQDANPEPGQDQPAADDANWNPLDLDHRDELTWERLLGLDGSWAFLEHVLWVVTLNTLFILIFAFIPYQLGFATMSLLRLHGLFHVFCSETFAGFLTTIVGYAAIALSLIIAYGMTKFTRFQRSRRLIGILYIVVKVSLLLVCEVGMFPVLCGWWLDVCSLPMLNATWTYRQAQFEASPGSCMFAHWLMGMIYVFYFASFVLLSREVVRPGVLWFLRNINDPDFNPVQDMIHLPVINHLHRFLLSTMILGTSVLLLVWLPVHFIHAYLPWLFPYNFPLISETPYNELNLELVLVQIIMPSILEHTQTKELMKTLVLYWCKFVAWLLNINSYLLGTEALNKEGDVVAGDIPADPAAAAPAAAGGAAAAGGNVFGGGILGAEHQAMMHQLNHHTSGFQAYNRPRLFAIRILLLLVVLFASSFISGILLLTVPVALGRKFLSFTSKDGSTRHELYTIGMGMYLWWLCFHLCKTAYIWMQHGTWVRAWENTIKFVTLCGKLMLVSVVVAVVLPLLLGVLVEQLLIIPVRVSLEQSPIYVLLQNWALGVLPLKLLAIMIMMGPQWYFKAALQQAYNDGIYNINVSYVFREVIKPIVIVLGLLVSVPYVTSFCFVPAFVSDRETIILVQRRIYPCSMGIIIGLLVLKIQARNMQVLFDNIRNDKYLIGHSLVNYEKQKEQVLLKKD